MSKGNLEFGLWLADIREKCGFKSQRLLADASGLSNSTIARIESGKQLPEPYTLKSLSLKLPQTTYEQLLEKAGYLEPPISESDQKKAEKILQSEDNLFDDLSDEDKREAIRYITYLRYTSKGDEETSATLEKGSK